jgi:hypothetical protein
LVFAADKPQATRMHEHGAGGGGLNRMRRKMKIENIIPNEVSLSYPSPNIIGVIHSRPVTVAERSKACTVFARSEAGIVGSNPIQGMDV